MTAATETDRGPRWFLGSRMTVLATAEQTDGAYGLMVQDAAKGFSPPLHIHSREDDGYLVLEGELQLQEGDRRWVVGAGEFVWLRRGVPHTFRVESEHARWIEIVSPGGFEAWHVACSDPAETDGLPPAAPVDVERVVRTLAPFGAEIVGPPLHD